MTRRTAAATSSLPKDPSPSSLATSTPTPRSAMVGSRQWRLTPECHVDDGLGWLAVQPLEYPGTYTGEGTVVVTGEVGL
nr:unnamed protein product [Digitaria exilis]